MLIYSSCLLLSYILLQNKTYNEKFIATILRNSNKSDIPVDLESLKIIGNETADTMAKEASKCNLISIERTSLSSAIIHINNAFTNTWIQQSVSSNSGRTSNPKLKLTT